MLIKKIENEYIMGLGTQRVNIILYLNSIINVRFFFGFDNRAVNEVFEG